jgi:peptidyl-prolyl cis-trans isomerase SurA
MLKNPEVYTDVRGAITADYQNYLEKVWIETLRNKYPVEINQEVLNSLR